MEQSVKVVTEIRRLSYSPLLASCARKLGLRDVMRRAYIKLYGKPGSLKFSIRETEAVFLARTPLELRTVEATWFSEQEMLSPVLSTLRRGDVFLDVGSNLGLFAVFAAKAVGPDGTVLAFEPETRAHRRLRENIHLNNLQNVRVHKVAMSDARLTRKLLLGDREGVSQSSRLSDANSESELVETVEYDSLVAAQAFPIPHVVKMDVEGHEFSALQGMCNTLSDGRCRGLFCELHPVYLPKGITVDCALELIRSFGFNNILAKRRADQLHIFATK